MVRHLRSELRAAAKGLEEHKQRSWDADGPGGCVLFVQNFTGGYCSIQQHVDIYIYVISYKCPQLILDIINLDKYYIYLDVDVI